MPIPRLAAGTRVISRPLSLTRPESNAITFSSAVLPEPLGPSSVSSSPGRTWSASPCGTGTGPYDLPMPSSSSPAPAAATSAAAERSSVRCPCCRSPTTTRHWSSTALPYCRRVRHGRKHGRVDVFGAILMQPGIGERLRVLRLAFRVGEHGEQLHAPIGVLRAFRDHERALLQRALGPFDADRRLLLLQVGH